MVALECDLFETSAINAGLTMNLACLCQAPPVAFSSPPELEVLPGGIDFKPRPPMSGNVGEPSADFGLEGFEAIAQFSDPETAGRNVEDQIILLIGDLIALFRRYGPNLDPPAATLPVETRAS
jgi:hypothetical protein